MSQKKLVEEIKTCILCWTGFFSEHRNVYQIMLKNTVQPDRRQVTIRYGAEKTHFAWSITKPKINAQNYCFLQQQCLCKRLSLPCYTYIEWLVTSNTGKTHITFSQSNVESNGNGFPNCAQQMFQTGQIFLTGFSRFSLVPQYLWPWDITPPPGLLPSTPFILRFIGVNICVCVYIYIYTFTYILHISHSLCSHLALECTVATYCLCISRLILVNFTFSPHSIFTFCLNLPTNKKYCTNCFLKWRMCSVWCINWNFE